MHTDILRVDVKMMGPASAAQQQNKGQQTQTEIQEILSDSEEKLLHFGGYRVTLGITEHLNRLPREVVKSLFLELFKTSLDMILCNLLYVSQL